MPSELKGSAREDCVSITISPFLQLPQEIRSLVFSFCRDTRWLIVSNCANSQLSFDYGVSGYRKLLHINRQIREEVKHVRLPPFSLHFSGRDPCCRFFGSEWSTCPETGQRYLGTRPGLLVGESSLRKIEAIRLAPGTTEVGYMDLSKLSAWLPSLRRFELDLRSESMWAYSRVPNVTRRDILVQEINWRLGTMFGVDMGALRQGQSWKLVVFANVMLPADPYVVSSPRGLESVTRLSVVSLIVLDGRLLTGSGVCPRWEWHKHRL
jgi:hypothetical protein